MTQPTRSQVESLLPWYVNGTLASDEQRIVETALNKDLVVRRELRVTRAFSDAILHAEPRQASAQLSLSRLHATIREDTKPTTRWRWFTGFLRCQSKPLQAALATMLLAVAGGLLWINRTSDLLEYETLTEQAPQIDGAVVVRVIFADDKGRLEIDRVVASMGGRIVAGPSRRGVFSVMAVKQVDAQDWLAAWRSTQTLRFAELAPEEP